MRWIAGIVIVAIGLGLGASVGTSDDDGTTEIGAVLDAFHDAASRADGEQYFGLMTDDAVFLGTDATERWTKSEFQAFAKPYFDKGTGWTYVSRERHIDIEPSRTNAWFDELLENESYGTCRGSGVLRREAGRWRIAQYNLSIPLPNAIARDVTGQIRRHEARSKPDAGRVIYVLRCAECEDKGADPRLTAEGRARAVRLACMLHGAGIGSVHTTMFARARLTASPLASLERLKIQVYARGAMTTLAEALRADTTDGAALVVAHRDSLPGFLKSLGVARTVQIGEDEHHRIFRVTLGSSTQAQLEEISLGD